MKLPDWDDFREAAGAGVGSGLGAAGVAVIFLEISQFAEQFFPRQAPHFWAYHSAM